ncbi:MAG: calcium-binding protein [Parvularcula sp.]
MPRQSIEIPAWALFPTAVWQAPFYSQLAQPADFVALDLEAGSSPQDLDDPAASILDRASFGASQGFTATLDDDILFGNDQTNMIEGLAGSDVINSLGGNDLVVGGLGDDFLNGGDGADVLIGDTDIDVDGLLASLGL